MTDARLTLLSPVSAIPARLGWTPPARAWHLAEDPGGSVELHVVLEGACSVRSSHGSLHHARAGDVVLLQRVHRTAEAQRACGTPATTLYACYDSQHLASPATLALLPRVLCASVDKNDEPVVAGLVTAIGNEERRPGQSSNLLLQRLFDALFVAVVRSATGKLVLDLRDARIAKTLTAIEQCLPKRWTLEELSRLAGMSRAAFSRRFLALTGTTPLGYVTRLRVQTAKALLSETDQAASAIAIQVGYQSEFAFSRVFKRWVGLPPATFRRVHQTRAQGVAVLRAAA